MKKIIIYREVRVDGQNFQLWYDSIKDILIILCNGKCFQCGRGLWQVFNKILDKTKNNTEIIEKIGKVISDIDIYVSSMDI